MKRFFQVSVLLNAVFAAALIWFVAQRLSAGDRKSPAAMPVAAAGSSPARTGSGSIAPVPAPSVRKPAQLFDWRLVESEDYRKYIANLRAIGCPEETIRDIITADVNKLFDSRRRTLFGSTNSFQYWKPGDAFGETVGPERLEQTVELAKEKRALLKELLGVEPEEKPQLFAGLNPYERMLDFLSPAKQSEVMDVLTKFQAKMSQTLGNNGSMDAEDIKQMQQAQKEMDAELAALLTPQEYQDYQVRASETAINLRQELAGFDPSEQEFLDIFKVKKEFDNEFGSFGMAASDNVERDKYDAAKNRMDGQLRSILGEARYADYQRTQDSDFKDIYRITQKNGLSADSAVTVYKMKSTAQEQAGKVLADKSLTPEQRAAAFKGIREETENSIRTILGDSGWKAYQKHPDMYWLKNLSPDQAHAP